MRIRVLLSVAIIGVLGLGLAFGDDLLSTKKESFNAAGVTAARLDTGAGRLEIRGDPAAKTIEVTAEFRGNPGNKEDAKRVLENLRLTMDIRGGTFYLKTEGPDNWSIWDWAGRTQGYIDVSVVFPAKLEVILNDGSGGLRVSGMEGRVQVEDGSGDVAIDGAGEVRIEDGSGSIEVLNVTGNVEIEDGSGSIRVEHVGGNVRINDGSGSIRVDDVGGRLEVPSGGSGSIHHQGVRGEVRIPEKHRTSRN